MKDTTAYKLFHDLNFYKYPLKILRPIKNQMYPLTSKFIVETPYANFYLDDMVKVTSIDEYDFNDFRSGDVVLDIGACIGSFSLKTRYYTHVKKIYSIEPVMCNRLKRNIILNNADNIYPIDMGIGTKKREKISWGGYTVMAYTLPLSELIELCGGKIDVLKIDCEGSEYTVTPSDLDGIRRIEAEVHLTHDHTFKEFLDVLDKSGFVYEYRMLWKEAMIVHAYRPCE
jgi:FkbM family methyltransferase